MRLKNVAFLSDLIGIFVKVCSKVNNNKLQKKSATLGIRYTSSLKYPVSNIEEPNMLRQTNPIKITKGLNQRSLEESDVSVSSITI